MTRSQAIRKIIESHFGLRTEAVSMISSRYSAEYPENDQIAVVLADAKLAPSFRAADEERLLDLLTTPTAPVVEIDRTATRVFFAVL